MASSSLEKNLKALQKLSAETKSHSDHSDEVHLIVSLNKTPSKFKLRPVILESSLEYSPKTCFILKDKDSETSSLLHESGVSSDDIYEISKLKAKFKVFEEKRVFAALYDRIIVDNRIFHLIPSVFGKAVFKKVKLTIPFEAKFVKSDEKCLKSLQSNICIRINTGSCVDVNIGKLSRSSEAITAAINEITSTLRKEMGQDCIKALHLKLPSTIAIPLAFESPSLP